MPWNHPYLNSLPITLLTINTAHSIQGLQQYFCGDKKGFLVYFLLNWNGGTMKIDCINQIAWIINDLHTTFHSTTWLLRTRIHQACMLTKEGMDGLEALAEIELKSTNINNKTQFIQPSRILWKRTIATQSNTMDVWWYHTVIIVVHSSFKQEKQETQ